MAILFIRLTNIEAQRIRYIKHDLVMAYKIILMHTFLMPKTLKKWGAYWFRLVRPHVRPSPLLPELHRRVVCIEYGTLWGYFALCESECNFEKYLNNY